jgi:hypothetical protein
MNKINLIIARYNENLDWIEYIPKNLNINIIIYNKGLDDISYPSIKLQNIGRESHTYLYYIIENYDNLADINISTQGDPFIHNPNFIYDLYKINTYEDIQPLSYGYSYNTPPPEITYLFYEKYKSNFYVDYLDNNFQPTNIYYYNRFSEITINDIKKELNEKDLLKYYIKKLDITNIKTKYLLPTSYAALFSVKKYIIKKRKIDFYKNMLNVLLDTKKFDMGYILERLWLMIFYYNMYNNNYLPLLKKDYQLTDITYKIKNNCINLDIPIIHNEYIKIIYNDKKFIDINIYLDYFTIKDNKKKVKILLKKKLNNHFIININVKNKILNIIIDKNTYNKQFLLDEKIKLEELILYNININKNKNDYLINKN